MPISLPAFAPAPPLTLSSFLPTSSHIHTHPSPLHPVLPHPPPRCRISSTALSSHSSSDHAFDAIIIGSGIGGLSCAAALTAYGLRPLVLESHYAAGGVAHGFSLTSSAGTFHFDTGPSFFCGLSTPRSLNPLKHALDAVHARVPCVSYDRFCIDDLRVGTLHVCTDEHKTLAGVRQLAGGEAEMQMRAFYDEMRRIHAAMDVPAIALRGDWRVAPVVGRRWAASMARLLPYVGQVKQPVSESMARVGVRDTFVRRMLDTEAFLLSGLKTDATITAEIAFMVGERGKPGAMEYPVGGARRVVDALVQGVERKGGEVRLRAHVDEIVVERGRAVGVRLRKGGRVIKAPHVFSNASLWDTVERLVPAGAVSQEYRKRAMGTPAVESFMHVHMAVRSEGLEGLIGHHAVILDSRRDIAAPGNTVMISVPTVWSPELAPPGWHVVHAYTLEPYERWPGLVKDRERYEHAKQQAAQPLMAAVRHVISDIEERLKGEGAVCKVGSPWTHARFNRRYRGTYGAAVRAGEAEFEWPGDIPIQGLKRCGDSTFPGIGVPSSAAAGLIAANELMGVREHCELVDRVFPK